MTKESRYEQRGVSASKDEVHAAIKDLDKGLFPLAFCKILPDVASGDGQFCNILHADTAGTKASLAYLYWRETGDLNVWKGLAQDAIVMNLDDMACVGCVDDILLSNTIGRNKHLIPGEVLKSLIEGGREFIEKMEKHSISIKLAGGETADVGDIVRTLDVGYTAFARMKRDELIINKIKHGDAVIGLASSGQTSYESEYNSGIGSNGLTSARHDILHNEYASRYPESFDPASPAGLVYSGSKKLDDTIHYNGLEYTVGKLLLSPTRTYLPVLKPLYRELKKELHGVIHCTGGGQAKVKKFMSKGLKVVKDNMFPLPPIFSLLKEESGAEWEEMYQVFNMGSRMEIYVDPKFADQVINLCRAFHLEAQVIGHVERSAKTEVEVRTENGSFSY